jgi:hypothetical protein
VIPRGGQQRLGQQRRTQLPAGNQLARPPVRASKMTKGLLVGVLAELD